MADTHLEPLLTPREREETYRGFDEQDVLTALEFVYDEFPEVFDQAAAKVGRVNAHLARLARKAGSL